MSHLSADVIEYDWLADTYFAMAKDTGNNMGKRIIVVGGANGVGKTTFAYQYRDEYGIEYLGADEIAANLSISRDESVEIRAGKEFFRRLQKYLVQDKSVIIESTLSGTGLLRNLNRFKSKGYTVHIIYVFLNDVSLCKRRIRARVKKGGHNVPESDVERRFRRSISNFQKIYLPLADSWQIFYNGQKRPTEVAIGEAGTVMIEDDEYYQNFLELSK